MLAEVCRQYFGQWNRHVYFQIMDFLWPKLHNCVASFQDVACKSSLVSIVSILCCDMRICVTLVSSMASGPGSIAKNFDDAVARRSSELDLSSRLNAHHTQYRCQYNHILNFQPRIRIICGCAYILTNCKLAASSICSTAFSWTFIFCIGVRTLTHPAFC